MTPLLTGVFASQISGHLTPPFVDNGSMEPIAMVQVGSAGTSYIEFTSIPNTYKHLQIRGIARDTWSASGYGEFYVYPNNDTTSGVYADHGFYGDGASAGSYGYSSRSDGMFVGNMVRNGSMGDTFGVFVIDILNYASNTKNKTARSLSGSDLNGSGTVLFQSALWQSTTPISSLRITPNGTGFKEYTQIALYGIKG